ncbi:MAG: hypothetical protein IPG22_16805 [Acidobacteria bacterium]|nr:hypothetical protein [Acidobacteriota bacterium]
MLAFFKPIVETRPSAFHPLIILQKLPAILTVAPLLNPFKLVCSQTGNPDKETTRLRIATTIPAFAAVRMSSRDISQFHPPSLQTN